MQSCLPSLRCVLVASRSQRQAVRAIFAGGGAWGPRKDINGRKSKKTSTQNAYINLVLVSVPYLVLQLDYYY